MLHKDVSLSALAAGFLAVLISYAGPAVIFFQAAQSAQVSHEMMASWIWAISIGAALGSIVLSWWLKVPAVIAWSAPGTALLVPLFPGLSLGEAVGAYITVGVAVLLIGLSGAFDRIVRAIPRGIASAMMAGILLQFGVGAFAAVESAPALALGMLAAYLVLKRLFPRYCLVLLMLVGVALSLGVEDTRLPSLELALVTPQFIVPEWSWSATLSLAVPLLLVSVTGQFLPGLALLRSSGYEVSARPLIAGCGLASLAVACFGGITIVTGAITATLCTGREAHEDPGKRYVAGMANGLFYLIGGSFAGAIILLFAAMPPAFVAVLAGLALLGAITANLQGALEAAGHREAAVITFIATASGMSFFGLGSAFWGVVIGGVAYLVLHHSGGLPRFARQPALAPVERK